VNVLAEHLFETAEDNCTPSGQLSFSLRECGTGVGFPLNNLQQPVGSLHFTCNDLGVQCIEVWARDKAGNAEKCEIEIVIDDSQAPCSSIPAQVFGWARTPLSEGIGEVRINLEPGAQPVAHINNVTQTNTTGYYQFPGFPLVDSYFVAPYRNDNPLNGVTTFDLVLISKHILGTEPFDSPYKMIAADANKSGSVTTFDIVELRKLILGIYDTLPLNRSWRFIDSAFVFPNPLNPFQTAFPEKAAIGNGSPVSFVGVKVGDVNLTAVPNAQGPPDERGLGTAYIDSEDRAVEEGDIVLIPFALASPAEGCQLTLEAEGLELLEILPGENTEKDHFALFPDHATLTMAWERGGKANFQIRAKALKNGPLRDMVSLSDRIARSEAYPLGSAEVQHLSLRFASPKGQMELFQNRPNPFSDKTEITFQLPSATTATLRISDVTGRLVWTKTATWPAGLNSVSAELSEIGPVGVLFCRLETAEQSLVRKMIRME
jgi:hypothetical protein